MVVSVCASRLPPSFYSVRPSGASLSSDFHAERCGRLRLCRRKAFDLSASVDIFMTREARAQHGTGPSRLRVGLRDLRSDSSVGLITLREDSCDVSIPERRLAVGVLPLSSSPSTGSSYVAYTGTIGLLSVVAV